MHDKKGFKITKDVIRYNKSGDIQYNDLKKRDRKVTQQW